jgi:hypothetical protein
MVALVCLPETNAIAVLHGKQLHGPENRECPRQSYHYHIHPPLLVHRNHQNLLIPSMPYIESLNFVHCYRNLLMILLQSQQEAVMTLSCTVHMDELMNSLTQIILYLIIPIPILLQPNPTIILRILRFLSPPMLYLRYLLPRLTLHAPV